MMDFFQVQSLDAVLQRRKAFQRVETQEVPLTAAVERILAQPAVADVDLPGFARSTMDGYAVAAASTYGASEGNPAYLQVVGRVAMGELPSQTAGPGETLGIATGGMLPPGTDSVVMVEHTEKLDDTTLEVYQSVAPGQHVVTADEDWRQGAEVLTPGRRLRPQEVGLLAAIGQDPITVYRRPRIGIISTGDEIIPVDTRPNPGQIRDVNSYTLASLIQIAGGDPKLYGIVKDRFEELRTCCSQALSACDMVLISGGSSVGQRDYTVKVLESIDQAEILVHGVTISPGKPTILARVAGKAIWGLPGHVTSAMVVFDALVRPFIQWIGGRENALTQQARVKARLSRNVASVSGRVDFVRVRLINGQEELQAEPILGKSGLLRTMVEADGIIEIDINSEGLNKNSEVIVYIL
ncbi:MAG: gephyrin-like molybdotransferase Glp [Desulfobacterales bacterium]|jgi:molybdopterin molybdotransferase